MPDNSPHLDGLIGQEVIVEMTNSEDVIGELESYEGDFSLTLVGDGTPDDVALGHLEKEFVDAKKVLNGSNVQSVEAWDGL
jgi:small nuclear ribonucleoprotein (snRNP)-like protein